MAGMEVDDGPARVGGKRHFSSGSRTSQICRYWQEGRCNKGDACQWQHSSPAAGTSGRLEGRLGENYNFRNNNNNNGGFIDRGSGDRRRFGGRNRGRIGGRGHSDGRRIRGPKACIYWLKGDCHRGDQCNFLHEHSANTDMKMMTQLVGHSKAVKGIALPDGSFSLYTGGQDKTVRLWNTDTGQCANVVPMPGEIGTLLSASFWLFVGLPNEVKAINTQTNAQQSLEGPKGQVYALAICVDVLFAGSHDGSILAWKFNNELNAFQPAFRLAGHSGAVVTMQAAGGRLYSGSMDKSIKVWDIASNMCLHTLQGHTNVVMGLLVWEQYLLSCSLDGYIKVWAATPSGGLEVFYTYPEDAEAGGTTIDGALALCGSVDLEGKPVLLCAYNDNTVRLFDLPSFTDRGILFTKDEVRVLINGPGMLVFSGENCGDVKVWVWSAKDRLT